VGDIRSYDRRAPKCGVRGLNYAEKAEGGPLENFKQEAGSGKERERAPDCSRPIHLIHRWDREKVPGPKRFFFRGG